MVIKFNLYCNIYKQNIPKTIFKRTLLQKDDFNILNYEP